MLLDIDGRSVGVISGSIVVDQVVLARVASRLQVARAQIGQNRSDARLRLIGAVHIGGAFIAVAFVPVVRSGSWVGIFDQLGRRSHRIPVAIAIECDISGSQVDKARAGAAHDSLMEVVADCIVIRDELEDRRVTLAHVVEAHRESALMSALAGKGSMRRLSLASHPGGDRDPWEQIVFALIELLPHLKESMDRIARERVLVRSKLGDLKWPIRQVCRKSRVRLVRFTAKRVSSVRLRQQLEGTSARGRNRIPIVIARLPLYRSVCARPVRALRIYHPFGEHIRDALPALPPTGGKKVIAASILPNSGA